MRIFSQMALHHLPDFWKYAAIRHVYDILKEGGKFYLKDVIFSSKIKDYQEFFNGFVEGVRAKTDEGFAEQAAGHIRDEFSTFDWVIEGFFRQAGFKLIETHYIQGFMGIIVGQK